MKISKALVTLLPHESKKLIGIGLTSYEPIREKMNEGKIFVARGTTNSYLLEEMLAISEFDKSCYVAGQIVPEGERLSSCPSEKRLPEIIFVNGKSIKVKDTAKTIDELTKGDIIIKGANALDPDGVAGVLIGNPKGGTCGAIWGTLMARGLHLIIPIGLEKLVAHSILYSSLDMGIEEIDYSDGYKCGFFPLHGEIFTEIEALYTLFDLEEITHIASGGVGGAEGAITLLLIGEDEIVKNAFEFCHKLKSIKPFKPTLG
ncbi:MAG TPA: hypothetical protein VMZ29_06735 [Candidatus Bathyarchaeia archaeon]|nr:hypothetical protein [Candidatus Bathyarchaeia archaeon]